MFALFRRSAPEPAAIEVHHEGAAFSVQVRRRAGLRRMTLRVSGATRDIHLSCPERTPFATIEAFARGHAGWIATRLAKLPERIPFAPDAVIPVRGVPHRIYRRAALRGRTQCSLDEAGEPIIAVSGDEAHLARRVRDFLQAEAKSDLAAAVARHAAASGASARRLSIRDTRSRWGSCSSTGTLSFSWRLILAPPFVLDYLAAHEVAHVSEMNHSKRFWGLVHELCARTDEAEAWLKRHGTMLHRYG